jgi:hypothetical protein
MATASGPILLDSQATAFSFGDHGFRYLTTGTTTAGEYFHTVFANEAAVITVTDSRTGTTTTGMVIPVGTAIYGCLTTITCTSGKITCYLRQPA